MRRPAVLCWLLLAGLAGGCVNTGGFAEDVGRLPTCTSKPGTVRRGVLIMAQSVPSAQWLPCIRTVPAGWSFEEIRPRDGMHALTVLLRPSCDITGATEVPSEHPEMHRYERVTRVSSGYGGERQYTFIGGCVTYRFDLHGSTRAEPIAAVSESLAFLSRQKLDEMVRQASGGRLRLDPSGGPES